MNSFGHQYPRVGGFVILLISLVLAKFCIYDPWSQAAAHVASLELHMKGVILSLSFGQIGLGLLLFGDTFKQLVQKDANGRLRPAGWLLVLAIVALSFGFYFWFEKQLSSFGYQF